MILLSNTVIFFTSKFTCKFTSKKLLVNFGKFTSWETKKNSLFWYPVRVAGNPSGEAAQEDATGTLSSAGLYRNSRRCSYRFSSWTARRSQSIL